MSKQKTARSVLSSKKRVFTISEAAYLLQISTKTLRRWEKKFGFAGRRTKGNQRRYTKSQIKHLLALVSRGERNLHRIEKLAIAGTQDLAAFGLTIQSQNPNSLYSTTFILFIDALVLTIKQLHKHINFHFVRVLKLTRISFTLLEITFRVLWMLLSLFIRSFVYELIIKAEKRLYEEFELLQTQSEKFLGSIKRLDNVLTYKSVALAKSSGSANIRTIVLFTLFLASTFILRTIGAL